MSHLPPSVLWFVLLAAALCGWPVILALVYLGLRCFGAELDAITAERHRRT